MSVLVAESYHIYPDHMCGGKTNTIFRSRGSRLFAVKNSMIKKSTDLPHHTDDRVIRQ